LDQRLTVHGLRSLVALRTGSTGADGSGHGSELPFRPEQLGFPENLHAADPA
jgi:hypothetical protein